ncbi:MAG: type II toxin-antitoxin system prevent-host-death family antitoxin [Chloroflexota bacterium]|nr:MAG: type II toxin-antitoxin system prevent-host-death family antitoxin [Chloroflexota bacterium]
MDSNIGIRELKAHLSAYLRRVKAGETLVITERNRPIGRIVPIGQTTKEQLASLVAAGVLSWNGEKLPPLEPAAHTKGERSVADLLVEDRE